MASGTFFTLASAPYDKSLGSRPFDLYVPFHSLSRHNTPWICQEPRKNRVLRFGLSFILIEPSSMLFANYFKARGKIIYPPSGYGSAGLWLPLSNWWSRRIFFSVAYLYNSRHWHFKVHGLMTDCLFFFLDLHTAGGNRKCQKWHDHMSKVSKMTFLT